MSQVTKVQTMCGELEVQHLPEDLYNSQSSVKTVTGENDNCDRPMKIKGIILVPNNFGANQQFETVDAEVMEEEAIDTVIVEDPVTGLCFPLSVLQECEKRERLLKGTWKVNEKPCLNENMESKEDCEFLPFSSQDTPVEASGSKQIDRPMLEA